MKTEYEVKELVDKKMRQAKFHYGERDRLKELKDKQQEVAKGLVEEMYSGDDNVVKEFVDTWLEEGEQKELFMKMKKFSKQLEDSRGYAEKARITEVFKTIFKDIRSQTKIVCDLYDEEHAKKYGSSRSKITIGKCGFGIRYNIQSRELSSTGDIDALVARKDDIVAGLKTLKLKAWADKFEKFIKYLPQVNKSGDVVFEHKLKKSYDLMPQYNDISVSSFDKLMFKSQHIFFKNEENGNEYHLVTQYGYRDETPYQVSSGRCYPTIMQIREELIEGLRKYVAFLEVEAGIASTSFEELRNNFAMELMLAQGGK